MPKHYQEMYAKINTLNNSSLRNVTFIIPKRSNQKCRWKFKNIIISFDRNTALTRPTVYVKSKMLNENVIYVVLLCGQMEMSATTESVCFASD